MHTERGNYWKEQVMKNNLYCLLICASTFAIDSFMVLVYFLSHKGGFPVLSQGYLAFYLCILGLSLVFSALFFLFRKNWKALGSVHLLYIILLLAWSCVFAVFDINHGNSAYVLAQILIFVSAGVRIPSILQCSLNTAAYLGFSAGLLFSGIAPQAFYNELINLFVWLVLSCIISVYFNRMNFRSHQLNQTIEQQTKKLTQYAEIDDLTGILNRRMIFEELKTSLMEHPTTCCIILDMDNFKQFNDKLGHLEGDLLLKETAQLLNDCAISKGGKAGRYGGEEFLLVFQCIKQEEVVKLMEELLEDIAAIRKNQGVTASAGGFIAPQGMDHRKALSFADHALYHVKCTGKNRFAWYQDQAQ